MRRVAAVALVSVVAACGGGDGDGTEAFCDEVRAVVPLPTSADGDIGETLAAARSFHDDLASTVPEAIEDEMQTLRDYVERLAAAHEAGATLEDLDTIDDTGVAAATAVIETFVGDNCAVGPTDD